MKKVFSTVFLGMLGGAFGLFAYNSFTDEVPPIINEKPAVRFVNMPASASAPSGSVDFTMAADRSIDAVVHVKTESQKAVYDPWTYFFGGSAKQYVPQRSSGSGVIVSDDGFIVTNNHVINGAQKVEVTLNNNTTFPAKVIGADPSTDLAVLKIEGKGLPYLPYGNSDDVKVGQWVMAVGNPFNLTSTVTAGIVSAKARNINLLEFDPKSNNFPIESFIQTDAAVNPGNSGGALVGLNGELIGINTAIASNTGSYAGYSFAIPVNIVKKVVQDLYEFGNVQRAFIGIGIADLNQEVVNDLDLPNYNGVLVASIAEGGAAKIAGIEPKDVITKVGNIRVNNTTELQEQVGKYRPGDRINIELLRDGKTLSKNLVLRNKEGNTKLNTKEDLLASTTSSLGATFKKADSKALEKLSLNHGVEVTGLNNGKFKEIGVKPGFIITRIDREAVKDETQIQEVLARKSGGVLIEGYYPNGTKAYYGFDK